jgi:hypothetical protein
MPSVRALVILSIKAKDALKTPVTLPESSNFAHHETSRHRIENTL